MTTLKRRSDGDSKQSLITSFFFKPKLKTATNITTDTPLIDSNVIRNVSDQSKFEQPSFSRKTTFSSSQNDENEHYNAENGLDLDDAASTLNTDANQFTASTVKRKIIFDDDDDLNTNFGGTFDNNSATIDIGDQFWYSSDENSDKQSQIDAQDNINIAVYNLDTFIYSESDTNLIDKADFHKEKLNKPENKQPNNPDSGDYIKEIEEKKYYLNCNASKMSKIFYEYIENYYLYCKIFAFPPWIQPQFIKDSNGKRPDHSDYNPSTLYIPPPSHKWITEYRNMHFTPTMKQYWSIKSSHFDKILLFKMGRFYELFYIDACIANKLCDLRWMGKESKPHVGFPEQSLQFYAAKFVASSYKVVVVEQMETPKEMLEKTKGVKGSEKVISREICQIFSKGTLLHSAMLPSEARPLLALVFNYSKPLSLGDQDYCNFGLCLVDVSTNNINLSFHKDDESRLALKTVLARINPAEILYQLGNASRGIIDIFKHLPWKPQLSLCEIDDNYMEDALDTDTVSIFSNAKEANNDLSISNKSLIVKALRLAGKYLSEMQLENMIKSSIIKLSDQYVASGLKLNSFVYDHLEIFTTATGQIKNSFFYFMDKTKTSFGSRLLRWWISSPCTDLKVINSRLNSLDWLVEHHQINNEIRNILASCTDLERQMGSLANNNTNKRAIQFDHVQSNRLLSLYKLLKGFEPFESLRYLLAESNSQHLLHLVTLENDGGAFPNLKSHISHFMDKLQIDDKQCYPRLGFYEKYDKIFEKIELITRNLDEELAKLSNIVKCELKFVHSKFKFEVECPENIYKKLSNKYQITSSRKGFIRFRTPRISELADELEDLEFERWETVNEFFKILLDEFRTFAPKFSKAIQIVAEIDCLSAFAYHVLSSPYPMCKPKLHPMDGKPFLHLEDSRHPIIGVAEHEFVPNNICMNCHGENNICLLLTGPNMGGKSTLLRQICLITIMAQIGSFVPAKVCEMTLVDKIFTRLGASDSIVDGKSTFYIELEETSVMMDQATEYSLAMIDELGRGTSTFDGTAIASSSLSYIANRLACRCIFSTHYHLICNEAKLIDTISLYHMDCSVVKDNVKFLYKFKKGECHKSQGLNVARIANVPESVIEMARGVAESMEIRIKSEHCANQLLLDMIRLLKSGDLSQLEILYNENRK